MRGRVFKRGNTYSIMFDVGKDPATGKRKQKVISGFKTKKEAEKALAEKVAEVERGTYLDPGKLTTGEWLQDWLKKHSTSDLSPTTIRGYRMIVEKHLIPAIGSIPLAKLQPVHLQNYYVQVRENGRIDGKPTKGTSLSPRTVSQHHRILHRALYEAERLNLISRNPADLVDPPKAGKKGAYHSQCGGSRALARRAQRHISLYTGPACCRYGGQAQRDIGVAVGRR